MEACAKFFFPLETFQDALELHLEKYTCWFSPLLQHKDIQGVSKECFFQQRKGAQHRKDWEGLLTISLTTELFLFLEKQMLNTTTEVY